MHNTKDTRYKHNLCIICHLTLASSNKTGRNEIQTLKGPRCWIYYSNQGGWGMSVSLKGCKFEHTELWIHFESFNDECEIVKEKKGRKSVEPGIKTNVWLLAAALVSFIIDHPCLKTDTFSIPWIKFKTMNFLGHTTSWSDYDMQYQFSRWHYQALWNKGFNLGDVFSKSLSKLLITSWNVQAKLSNKAKYLNFSLSHHVIGLDKQNCWA